jgi:hypothetical protein
VFAAAGVGIWSQLTVDWQWSSPADPGTTAAMFVMSGALAVLSVLAVLAALPVASSLAKAFARDGGSHLTRPLALVAVGLAVLIAGSIHFGHGWPGTGGHPWADHGLVPGFVARFCWAATLWITSYWAHPGALSAFPAAEIGWMAVSPFALAAVVVGAGQLVRRLRLGPRALRYETWLGRAAGVTMAAFFAGAASWVVSSAPGPRLLFRVGAIDGVALAVMAGAVLVAFRALGRVPPKHGRPAG